MNYLPSWLNHPWLSRGWSFALLALIYIVLIWQVMSRANGWFVGTTGNTLAPLVVLPLFVLSALVMGVLFLGKPVLLYLDGKKAEAVKLFLASGSYFALFTLLVLILVAIASRLY